MVSWQSGFKVTCKNPDKIKPKEKNSRKIHVDNCYMYVPSNFIEIVEI